MRQIERNPTVIEGLEVALDALAARLWCALPGTVLSYDAVKGTCQVQPTIQGQIRNPNGTHDYVNLPVLQDVPVIYMGGGPFVATFPIQVGDEALVIFADRCIDYWWQSGGIQIPFEPRMHDLSDGFALIGPRSLARSIPNVSTTNAQLRSARRSDLSRTDAIRHGQCCCACRYQPDGPGHDQWQPACSMAPPAGSARDILCRGQNHGQRRSGGEWRAFIYACSRQCDRWWKRYQRPYRLTIRDHFYKMRRRS